MSDIDLLNGTIYGEWYGVIAYELAIGTGLLDDATTAVANKFKQDHINHAAHLAGLVTERGGTPSERPGDEVVVKDLPEINDAGDIIKYAIFLESTAAINDNQLHRQVRGLNLGPRNRTNRRGRSHALGRPVGREWTEPLTRLADPEP
jgi:hypothetical protein